ncbi:MAG: T9SS type A sorting domain-containing protein, partial [Salinivirgaceae bacterium]|nr:T9SS type A sorting domain-containing protein [Salinivirgaceae bacterium]
LDMIANNNYAHNSVNVQTSLDIKEQAFLFSELIDNFTLINAMSTGNSDHASFKQYGYPILYYHEYDFSPVYHSPKDLYQYLNMDYCSLVVQATLANLVAFSSMLEAPVVNIAGNCGTGNGVYAEWESVEGAFGYNIRLKSGQETVVDTSVVNVNSLLIENVDYQEVVLTISAIDAHDFEGKQYRTVINLSSVPDKIEGLEAIAERSHIELSWNRPAEQDLQYILVLMRYDNSDQFDSIAFVEPQHNSTAIANIEDEIVHFKIKSVDNEGNHGLDSKIVSTALATFNKGLLVVIDATANPFGFSADSIRNFFGALNSTLPTTIINAKKDMPNIFKSYNIVLWHSTVAALSQTMVANQKSLERYVVAGGSLVISTDYPQQLLNIRNSKTGRYSMGNPVRTFMGISETSYINNSRMQMAQGIFAPDLIVDLAKVSVNFEGNLKNFCAMEADAPFVSLYRSFTSQTDNLMNGNSVGFISYEEPKMCVLAFPLFFFEYSSVRTFMQFLNEEGFYTLSPSLEVLTQNWEAYPNPFSDIISFDFVPEERDLSIVIYNMQGMEVFSTLFAKLPVLEKKHIEINLSSLAKGAYILKVGDRKELIIKK